jgi:hypothetical protein
MSTSPYFLTPICGMPSLLYLIDIEYPEEISIGCGSVKMKGAEGLERVVGEDFLCFFPVI